MNTSTHVKVYRYKGKKQEIFSDRVVREVPFTLFLNDDELVTLVCTPENLEELAAGFLCGEGILNRPEDLKGIKVNLEDGLIWVETTSPAPAAGNFLKRYITTCCGKGRASFYFVNDARGIKPLIPGEFILPLEKVKSLAADLEDRALLFRATGGAHGAALCTPDGIICFFEDIGRHNAVDKVFGHSFLKGIPLSDKIVLVSGRISSEILIKAARMGAPVIISRSAPTDLALQMADRLGITVAGFVRGDRANVYTHPERIKAQGQE